MWITPHGTITAIGKRVHKSPFSLSHAWAERRKFLPSWFLISLHRSSFFFHQTPLSSLISYSSILSPAHLSCVRAEEILSHGESSFAMPLFFFSLWHFYCLSLLPLPLLSCPCLSLSLSLSLSRGCLHLSLLSLLSLMEDNFLVRVRKLSYAMP